MLKRMLPERFMSKVDIQPDGCWLWNASKSNGYGYFRYNGNLGRAHRFSYQQIVGPIPDELELDHLCRNKDCCNPVHLEAVTHKENMRRCDAGKNNSSKTHCLKGHPYDNENTYNRLNGGRGCRKCRNSASRKYTTKRKNQ